MATRLQPPIVPATAAAVIAALVALAVLWFAWPEQVRERVAPASVARVPRAPVPAARIATPPVEPNIFAPLKPEDARAYNARVPVASGPLAPAPRFTFAGSPGDRAAAVTCLAAAVLYEAGDDAKGEEAVAQGVINRLRHPAFPKTVCGVVFQGSERRTGCQFTFTCDGALRRPPRPAAWERARDIAARALSGHVDERVGTATHYHADWVVPYWKASLDKIAQFSGHIFYRWHGAWGLPAMFHSQPRGGERLDPRLLSYGGAPALDGSPSGLDTANAAETALASLSVPGVSRGELRGSIVRAMDADAGQFVLQLGTGGSSDYARVAKAICGSRPNCMVMGWLNADRVPAKLPVMPVRMQSMAFLYRKNGLTGTTKAYWNCGQIRRSDRGECLPGTAR